MIVVLSVYLFQLQLLLTDYLDIQNTAGEPRQTSSFSEPASDISAFFSR